MAFFCWHHAEDAAVLRGRHREGEQERDYWLPAKSAMYICRVIGVKHETR